MNLKESLRKNVTITEKIVAQAEWWNRILLPWCSQLEDKLKVIYLLHSSIDLHLEPGVPISAVRPILDKAFNAMGVWKKEIDPYSGDFYYQKKVERGTIKLYTEMPETCKLIEEKSFRTVYRMECTE